MKTGKSSPKKPAQTFTPFASQKALNEAQKKAAVEFQLDQTPHLPSMYDPVETPEPVINWSPPKSWGLE